MRRTIINKAAATLAVALWLIQKDEYNVVSICVMEDEGGETFCYRRVE